MWEYQNFYKGEYEPLKAPNLSEQLVKFLNENRVTEWRVIKQTETYLEIVYKPNHQD